MRWCVSLIMRLMRRRVGELQSCAGLAGAIHTADWVSRFGLADEPTEWRRRRHGMQYTQLASKDTVAHMLFGYSWCESTDILLQD